jgi:hypothetical protein
MSCLYWPLLSNCTATLHDHAVYTAHLYSNNISRFEGEKEPEAEGKQNDILIFNIFF